MRVLLISANPVKSPYPVYPIGLDYVMDAVSVRHTGAILDVNTLGGLNGTGESSLENAVREFGPDLVGISIRNIDNTDTAAPVGFIPYYRELVRAVRKASPAPLVLGGSGFTLFPRELMKALGADYGVVGEGERLAALLAALERGEDPTVLPGIVTGSDGFTPAGPAGRLFARRFDAGAGHLSFYLKHGGMLNLQTQRGCPFRCVYCTYPAIEGRRLRRMDPEAIAATAVGLQKAGARYLFITDSAFNADEDHSLAVAGAFNASELSIPWGAFFAPKAPPKDYFRRMADAGLTHVEFGTESLSDAVLIRYRKPFRADHATAAHREAIDAGLHVAHYFLLGGPGETRDTLTETLNRIDKLHQTVLFFFCGMRIYPGTELCDIARREGKITPAADLLAPVFYESSDVDREEILRRVRERSEGRPNWVMGAGGDQTAAVLAKLYARGHTGPLWEHLIR